MAKHNCGKQLLKKRVLNLAIQNLAIKQRFPGFSQQIYAGRAVWRGSLQPRVSSSRYLVEIEYSLSEIPKARVLSPALHSRAVHLYADKNLCLYWPREWDWTPDQLIGATIIPWVGSWLFFYELWLDTGKWLGPSSHDYFPLK
jgi:hypothetical protein